MKKPITDHLGNHYESIKKMCDTYGINEKTYHSRVNRDKYTLEEALGVMPRLKNLAHKIVVDDRLTILNAIHDNDIQSNLYYSCILDNFETIMTYNEIFDYYRKNIF